ncbi:FAD-dependent oxidoreductase [Acidisoma silvae]|uniref:FAD-dependent oxidoreductase n=1 Tax=Acidisoma silvae TaxID=2802396 RepID=UPI001D0BD423|nr:FAD/NAD(P)-binding oxidoreductase [Acidisoma silvae]
MTHEMLGAEYDVVVVGGGTAGLAAAAELRRRDVGRVLVLEREEEAGGIPRHCAHPPFGVREYGRLMTGPSYARLNVARALASGAEIRTGVTAVALKPDGLIALATPHGLAEVRGRRVLLCLGAREMPRSARLIGGSRPRGVINTGALQSAVNLKHIKPFEAPLILGTELVSLSAILTCRHAGIRPVAMIEPAAKPIARWPLTLFPRIAGVPLYLGASLHAIEGESRVRRAVVRLADGHVRYFDCDGILLTGGFTPESAVLRLSNLAIDPGTGGPVTDSFGRCSDASYFAAGNLLRPVETSGWCWREGKRMAALIAEELASGLPDTARMVTVTSANPVRYAVPQRVLAGDSAGTALQLRVSRHCTGTLSASQGGHVLVSRRGDFRPERRILLQLPPGLAASTPIEIALS